MFAPRHDVQSSFSKTTQIPRASIMDRVEISKHDQLNTTKKITNKYHKINTTENVPKEIPPNKKPK